VFTARYALSPYIKQIRFVFKGLTPSDSQLTMEVLILQTSGMTHWSEDRPNRRSAPTKDNITMANAEIRSLSGSSAPSVRKIHERLLLIQLQT
jgi:hypothetical protein